jgi:hypothetical protein
VVCGHAHTPLQFSLPWQYVCPLVYPDLVSDPLYFKKSKLYFPNSRCWFQWTCLVDSYCCQLSLIFAMNLSSPRPIVSFCNMVMNNVGVLVVCPALRLDDHPLLEVSSEGFQYLRLHFKSTIYVISDSWSWPIEVNRCYTATLRNARGCLKGNA